MLEHLNKLLPSAAVKIEQLGKVTPEVVMIVYLDEIAGRIAQLNEKIDLLIPEGHIRGIVIPVTDAPQRLGETDWYSADLFNDGEGDVYIFDEYELPRIGADAPLKKGESLKVDLKAKTGTQKYIVCPSGQSASVRVFRKW